MFLLDNTPTPLISGTKWMALPENPLRQPWWLFMNTPLPADCVYDILKLQVATANKFMACYNASADVYYTQQIGTPISVFFF